MMNKTVTAQHAQPGQYRHGKSLKWTDDDLLAAAIAKFGFKNL